MPRDPQLTRVEIVIKTDDPNPDLLFVWVAARAIKMIEHLRSSGVSAEIVKIEIDGHRATSGERPHGPLPIHGHREVPGRVQTAPPLTA